MTDPNGNMVMPVAPYYGGNGPPLPIIFDQMFVL